MVQLHYANLLWEQPVRQESSLLGVSGWSQRCYPGIDIWSLPVSLRYYPSLLCLLVAINWAGGKILMVLPGSYWPGTETPETISLDKPLLFRLWVLTMVPIHRAAYWCTLWFLVSPTASSILGYFTSLPALLPGLYWAHTQAVRVLFLPAVDLFCIWSSLIHRGLPGAARMAGGCMSFSVTLCLLSPSVCFPTQSLNHTSLCFPFLAANKAWQMFAAEETAILQPECQSHSAREGWLLFMWWVISLELLENASQ